MIKRKWFVLWQACHPRPGLLTRCPQQLEHSLDLRENISTLSSINFCLLDHQHHCQGRVDDQHWRVQRRCIQRSTYQCWECRVWLRTKHQEGGTRVSQPVRDPNQFSKYKTHFDHNYLLASI